MPPSGTEMSAIEAAITSEFWKASQKSLSAKMNANAPPLTACGMKNGAFSRL